jgi:uncharacterized membrane protein
MDKRALRWVYRELPDLVSQGVIPPDVAENIRRHYGGAEAAGSASKRWAIILFSVLGAALIGGGIILLLAHNWEQLSRPARAAISISPLAVCAAIGAWLLWTRRPGTAWREGVATAQTLAIGASISLVAQTYNLGGAFSEFMLTWSLLSLPLAYLLSATLPALLYLVGITVWTGSVMHHGTQPLAYFPLLFLILPFLWVTARANRYHPRPVLIAWVLAVTLGVGGGMAVEPVCSTVKSWPVLFAGLFSLLFLAGTRWWCDASAAWQRPMQNIGALGAVGLSLLLSFSDPWPHTYVRPENMRHAALEVSVVIVICLAALALWVRSWPRRAWHELILGALPIPAVLGYIIMQGNSKAMAAALFSLYLFLLGIVTLVAGLRSRRLGVVNGGMLVLSAVILCRFFDADLPFVLRGIGFILVGIGFLAANIVLLRRKGEVIQ